MITTLPFFINPIFFILLVSGVFIWNLILLFFIIGNIIAISLLFVFSKKTKEYKNEPIIEEYYIPGSLNRLATALRASSVKYNDDNPIKKYIEELFFDKIQQKHFLTLDEIKKLYMKDEYVLEKYVKDKEISNWILNRTESKFEKGFFKKDAYKKEQYMKETKSMIEKMEAWGK